MTQPQLKVLAVFANRHGTQPLGYGSEGKVIRESILLSRQRDRVDLTMRHVATLWQLRKLLVEERFDVLHLSGHDTGHGLELEDEAGWPRPIAPAELGDLLRPIAPSLRCVLLNECYSLAEDLTPLRVPLAVVLDVPIDDEGAVEFFHGFYNAIAAGKGGQMAYLDGCRSVQRAAPGMRFVARVVTPATVSSAS